ncbi:MAG: hypothetical protein A3G37_01815 [Omnitrophica WOR_2 bacterium RIFCSPLOWO2_12_FULL_46_30]|nr:MAG: hypothetical protein A3D27_01775 [Omnitrophica WOR_2 bacterium RIFCSPHIGHO2_02_FULL_46_37]OGX42035.1 MAG: hypothetical protein A3H41_00790 [Omnitrophica WOR_2 bacterium RIFCSPLOWO2_02_FULL_45_28]OGX52035.1 MAG: hypothetical protein A3G37_01815 [Omnitrophica WOR_2 bacterium RIFCSPLOWO2_12_FULL_46_30]
MPVGVIAGPERAKQSYKKTASSLSLLAVTLILPRAELLHKTKQGGLRKICQSFYQKDRFFLTKLEIMVYIRAIVIMVSQESPAQGIMVFG